MKDRARSVSRTFRSLATDIESGVPPTSLGEMEQIAMELDADKPHIRKNLIDSGARGEISAEELDRALDGARWLRRLAYHGWRIGFYWSEFEGPSE